MKIDESWYIKPKNENFPRQELTGGVIVRRENNKLLIAFIGDTKFSNYILPKGRIEKGELEENAARREIKEETGFDKLVLIKKLGIKERLTFDKTTWNTYHYFLFVTNQKSGIQKLEPEEKDYVVRWFEIDNLPPMFWPEQKELIEENKKKIKKTIQEL